MTDKQKILKWFKTRRYLTDVQAIHKLGVYNVRSRASEMRLDSRWIDVKRVDGKLTKVKQYFL